MPETVSQRRKNSEAITIVKSEFDMAAGKAVDLTLRSCTKLLKPKANIYDALALGGYVIGGALNAAAHSSMSLEFPLTAPQADPEGFVFFWEGHKYKPRAHIMLKKKQAKAKILELADRADKRLALSVLMKNGVKTLVKEGFSQEELAAPDFIPGMRLVGLTHYNKMYLLYEQFKNAERPSFVPELPTADLNWKPVPVKFPELADECIRHIFGVHYYAFIQRISLNDFPEIVEFHKKNGLHSAINPKDVTTPNYKLSINDKIVATTGNSFEVPVHTEQTGTIPLVLAANLLVRPDLQDLGIGPGLSYAVKDQTFARNPDAVYIADNVRSTTNIWTRYGADHIVATTAWPLFERV